MTGQAGGAKLIDAERAALFGLIAALKEPRGSRPSVLHTASALAAAIPARIEAAQGGEAPPAENLDLWAQATIALAAAPVQLIQVTPAPRTPSDFAAHWAEFARDRARDKGAFTAPIPKANLARAGVPAA